MQPQNIINYLGATNQANQFITRILLFLLATHDIRFEVEGDPEGEKTVFHAFDILGIERKKDILIVQVVGIDWSGMTQILPSHIFISPNEDSLSWRSHDGHIIGTWDIPKELKEIGNEALEVFLNEEGEG